MLKKQTREFQKSLVLIKRKEGVCGFVSLLVSSRVGLVQGGGGGGGSFFVVVVFSGSAVCEAQFPSLFRYLPFVFCQCYCKQLKQAKATVRFSTLE